MLLCVFAENVCGLKCPDENREQFLNSGSDFAWIFFYAVKDSSSL